MTRRNTLVASMSMVLAFGAAALMAAAPADDTTGTGGQAKDYRAGQDHPSAGKKKDGDKGDKARAKDAKGGATIGQKAPEFQFTDVTGKSHSLSEFAGKTVVMEWINPGCPICKGKVESGAVAKMMTQVKEADPTAVFIFVNSTNPDMGGSADSSAKYLKDNKIEGIAFWEADGAVGHLYGAATTPHLFVIDKTGTLAYSGAIDDERADKKGVNFVVNAVKALKEGKTPSPATSKPYGCDVKYSKSKA